MSLMENHPRRTQRKKLFPPLLRAFRVKHFGVWLDTIALSPFRNRLSTKTNCSWTNQHFCSQHHLELFPAGVRHSKAPNSGRPEWHGPLFMVSFHPQPRRSFYHVAVQQVFRHVRTPTHIDGLHDSIDSRNSLQRSCSGVCDPDRR